MTTIYEALLQMDSLQREQYMQTHREEVLTELLQHIGSANEEHHDKIVYRLFGELMTEGLFLTEQLARTALLLPTKDYLFKNIANGDADSVFTRSFSALWLVYLLYYDGQLSFLTPEEAQFVMTEASRYLEREQDVRGFVEGQGWAHSVAHGADLFAMMITHPHFQPQLVPVLLQGIKVTFWKGTVYANEEEDRLAQIFEQLVKTDFPEEVCIEWVEQVFDKLALQRENEGYTMQFFDARMNVLRFMRALYFTLKFSHKMPQLQGVVSIFIGKWTKL
ncbi:DUF2785 domain-containing protein [Metasolibacillus sp.]|uniref:DUF2785 domain-containing protein n=1 Tax=Metasolibacillus sp. TaxID=2703680 RepID=UPI0025DAE850|nr:DUF2785 domain-containing protein [Metasolibacillus sp.]MCT6922880.1 DUF2785 domain-containing protein [Metasolibacillus sp.]MCT6939118.1 DUF2785 domain-containing protein [Metasolibacillus sp.]